MVARTNSPESMKLVSKISAVSDSELLALSSGVFGFFFFARQILRDREIEQHA